MCFQKYEFLEFPYSRIPYLWNFHHSGNTAIGNFEILEIWKFRNFENMDVGKHAQVCMYVYKYACTYVCIFI